MGLLTIQTDGVPLSFVGRLHQDRPRPVLLAIGGAFPPKDYLHDLIRIFSGANVLVVHLPGMGGAFWAENPDVGGLTRGLDRELERRGHAFARYADDCNVYLGSRTAAEHAFETTKRYLESELKLQVNREKSAVAPAWERKFLGYRLLSGGRLGLAPSSADRAKDRLRHLTRRNRGRALEEIIGEINRFTVGWLGYFRYAECRSWLRDVDGWLRQKLRCYRLKQAKRTKAIADLLRSLGVPEQSAWATAACSRGWWRTSHTPGANTAMDQAWFDRLGLISLMQRHTALNQP